jgi:hypothetical protein
VYRKRKMRRDRRREIREKKSGHLNEIKTLNYLKLPLDLIYPK